MICICFGNRLLARSTNTTLQDKKSRGPCLRFIIWLMTWVCFFITSREEDSFRNSDSFRLLSSWGSTALRCDGMSCAPLSPLVSFLPFWYIQVICFMLVSHFLFFTFSVLSTFPGYTLVFVCVRVCVYVAVCTNICACVALFMYKCFRLSPSWYPSPPPPLPLPPPSHSLRGIPEGDWEKSHAEKYLFVLTVGADPMNLLN